ncbi:hypothetical protein FKM82_003462 [Ascaphus truei]
MYDHHAVLYPPGLRGPHDSTPHVTGKVKLPVVSCNQPGFTVQDNNEWDSRCSSVWRAPSLSRAHPPVLAPPYSPNVTSAVASPRGGGGGRRRRRRRRNMAAEGGRESLPEHWSYGVCKDGRVFFIKDQGPGSTCWLHPRTGEPVNSGHMIRSDLPRGWEEGFTDDGASYFIKDITLDVCRLAETDWKLLSLFCSRQGSHCTYISDHFVNAD